MGRHADALSGCFAIEIGICGCVNIYSMEVDGSALRSTGIDQDRAVTIETTVHTLILKHSTDGHANRSIVLRMIDIVSILLLTTIEQCRKVPFGHQIGRDVPF